MRLYSDFVDVKLFEKEFDEFKHIDFSFFFERRPTARELSLTPINFYGLEEPNEYTGNHDWAIQNKNSFQVIFTWSDKMLRNCENAILSPFGNSWFISTGNENMLFKKRDKVFCVSFLRGNLLKTYGHMIRHEIFSRENEIDVPVAFYATTEPRTTFQDYIEGKEKVLGSPMFSVIIENTSYNHYFTEKIVDCMLFKTVPIYWGCSNIDSYFDARGIIRFSNADDAIDKINSITKEDYQRMLPYVEENYKRAFLYGNHVVTIKNQLREIFKHNGIL